MIILQITPLVDTDYIIENRNGALSFIMQPGGNKLTPQQVLDWNRTDPAAHGRVRILSVINGTALDRAKQFCIDNPTAFSCKFNNNHDFTTMEPIGGGPGYTKIIISGQYHVTNKTELISALSAATSGEIIFIDGNAEIDLSGEQLDIPAGVTLASNRGVGNSNGALLISNTTYDPAGDPDAIYVFRNLGSGVRITGIRMKGPTGETYPAIVNNPGEGISSFISAYNPGLEVDNCEIYNSNTYGVLLTVNESHYIHHNHIHHTRRGSLGYGIWCRTKLSPVSTPLPDEDITLIEGNLMDNCRHEIASAGSEGSSYIARYNFINEHSTGSHSIDRHGGIVAICGDKTIINYNVVSNLIGKSYSGHIGEPKFIVDVQNNFFEHATREDSTTSEILALTNLIYANNSYGQGFRSEKPTCSLVADTVSGAAPLTVNFTASGTHPDMDVDAYIWRELNNNYEITSEPILQRTYTTPGLYLMTVMARNASGIPSEPKTLVIEVKNTTVQPTLKDKMICWFPMDEASGDRIDDHYGYKFDTQEGPTPFVSGPGNNGDAMILPGDTILRSSDKKFNDAIQLLEDDITFSFWVRPDLGSNTDTNKTLFYFGGGGVLDTGVVIFSRFVGLSVRISTNFETQLVQDNGDLTEENWHHCVVQIDRDGTVTTTIDNNKRVDPNPVPSNPAYLYNAFERLSISLPTGSLQYYSGRIQHFAMWRRLLSDTEISTLYAGGAGITYADIV